MTPGRWTPCGTGWLESSALLVTQVSPGRQQRLLIVLRTAGTLDVNRFQCSMVELLSTLRDEDSKGSPEVAQECL